MAKCFGPANADILCGNTDNDLLDCGAGDAIVLLGIGRGRTPLPLSCGVTKDIVGRFGLHCLPDLLQVSRVANALP